MVLPAALLLFGFKTTVSTLEIPTHFVRAGRIVATLRGGFPAQTPLFPTSDKLSVTWVDQSLIPKGIVSLGFDDTRGVVVAEGNDPESLQRLSRVVAMFDVESRLVQTKVEVEIPSDKFRANATLDLTNGRPMGLHDYESGIEVIVADRINDDGTITVTVGVQEEKSATDGQTPFHSNFVFRIRNGMSSTLNLDSRGSSVGTSKMGTSTRSVTTPLGVTVTPTILEVGGKA